MFEELKRKEDLKELKELIIELGLKMHDIGIKLDKLSKYSTKEETPPRMAQKQVKNDISQ